MAHQTKHARGLVIGRFQPLHWGHVEYIFSAFTRCQHLYVGISHPDPNKYFKSEAAPHRHNPSENPFSFELRKKMVTDLFADWRVNSSEFDIVPARLEDSKDLTTRIPPREVHVFVTIYDDWGLEKKALLEDLGYKVEVLWKRRETVTRGIDIRARIRSNESPWEHLVPPSTQAVVNEFLRNGGRASLRRGRA